MFLRCQSSLNGAHSIQTFLYTPILTLQFDGYDMDTLDLTNKN